MTDIIVGDRLQIIHCQSDLWIIASTSGCKEVQVYDSLYRSPDQPLQEIIPNLFSSNDVKMFEWEKQVGGTDCGLFAIMYGTAIAYNPNPQLLMKNHLLKCFEDETISYDIRI